jgi:ribosome maturation factor RimP
LISRQVSAILDVEDLVPGNSGYVLEVSSPGMDRKLVKPEHFRRFSGCKVKVTTRQPIEGQRRNFSGRLEGLEDERVRLQLEGGRTVEIELQQIERANLVPEWD